MRGGAADDRVSLALYRGPLGADTQRMARHPLPVPIWSNWTVRLTEEVAEHGDPDPCGVLTLPAAQFGDGRCQCGRRLPAANIIARLDRAELVDFARAILAWDEYTRAHSLDRAGLNARVQARRESLDARERAADERARLRKLGTPGPG